MPISIDGRMKFQTTVPLQPGATGSLAVEVFGGPLARVQAAVFAADDSVLQGVGFDNFGPPLTTEFGGKANWLFKADARAAYIKWGVQAVRSAANLGSYSVTAKVRQADGGIVSSGQFSAQITDGQFADDIIYDGVNLATAAMPAVVRGAVA